MALKDWEKQNKGLVWIKRDEDTLHDFIDLEIKNKTVSVWSDSGTNDDEEINFEKQFKTKSQALKFARAYMRKN